MNKYAAYIIGSIVMILIPLLGTIFVYWDASQPKTGAVGGTTQPTFTPPQLAINIAIILTGLVNLFVAIKRYLDYKNNIEKKEEK